MAELVELGPAPEPELVDLGPAPTNELIDLGEAKNTSTGKRLLSAFEKGTLTSSAGFLDEVHNIAMATHEKLTGQTLTEEQKNTALKKASDFLKEKAGYWDNILKQQGAEGVDTIAGDVAGSIVPGILEFATGTTFAAAKGVAQAQQAGEGIGGQLLMGAKEGVKRFVMGKLLQKIAKIPGALARRGTAATMFGAVAAVEGGTTKEVLTQATVGGILQGKEATKPEAKVEIKPDIVQEARKAKLAEKQKAEIPTIESIGKKVSDQLENVQDLRTTVADPAIKVLRAKQAGQYRDLLEANKSVSPEERQGIAKSGLKEEADVPEVTPPDITPVERQMLFARNEEVHTDSFDIVNTHKALTDWLGGKILQDSQFKYLSDILGPKPAQEIYHKQQELKPFNAWDYLKMGFQFAKMPFAFDVQFFRQASSFAARHPLRYVKSGYTALKSYVSEAFAERISQQIRENPNHQDARNSGINFLSEAPWSTVAGKELAPEQFAIGRPVVQRLLKYGLNKTPAKRFVTKPIRGMARWYLASERSMITSCNQFMQGLWDTQTRHWETNGDILSKAQLADLESSGQLKSKNINPDIKALVDKTITYKKNYADTVNTFMKILRAKTRSGQAIQQAANFVLFSPSMTASRLKRPYTLLANVGSRRYAAGLVATEIGKIFLISALVKMTGLLKKDKDGKPSMDSSLDPRATDWGTIHVGNGHYDLGGGDTQYYRSLARFITGKVSNQAGNIRETPRRKVLEQYAKSRETALIGIIAEIATGRNFQGEKIWEMPDWEHYTEEHKGPLAPLAAETGKLAAIHGTKVEEALYLGARELAKAVAPQFLGDIFNAAIDDGWAGVLATQVADTLSANAQIYPESASVALQKEQNKSAQIEYQKNWDDLSPNQQKSLTNSNPAIKAWEQQTKFERSEKDQEIAVKPKQLDLPNNIRREFRLARVAYPAVSRNIGSKFYLNDERFKSYQAQAINNITSRVTEVMNLDNWSEMTQDQKNKILTKQVEIGKEMARRQIISVANLEATLPQSELNQ